MQNSFYFLPVHIRLFGITCLTLPLCCNSKFQIRNPKSYSLHLLNHSSVKYRFHKPLWFYPSLLLSYLCPMSNRVKPTKEVKNIRQLSLPEVEDIFLEMGEKKFRAKQVWEWLWQKNAASFADMTNLSKDLRQKLGEKFSLPALNIDTTQISADGTVKSRFVTHEGHLCEGVLIPTGTRYTACVSSQIGCSLSCKFCATGYMDKKRNLEFDEIYDEVTLLNQQSEKTYGNKLSNIVFMGMGEPLLNYKNVLRAIERISAADGLAMSPRRITVSTAGVAKMIRQLGDDKVRFKLALSLHAATDAKRNEIMPINETNNLKALVDALNYFYKETKNEITLEYILFNNFNDSAKDADDLIKVYRQVPADLVNIIEYNPIEFAKFQKPSAEKVEDFMAYLEKNKVNARLRRSRGKDIDAACGQLANKANPVAAVS
jgi:23S rRNA (adenine2503-C2)-methyltransferase